MKICIRKLRIAAQIALAATLCSSAGAEEVRAVSFNKDVLPILQRHCQECHRPNQIAPMSLLTFNEARPWAKAIRKAVSERTMPPFHANAPLGHFRDDNRLSDAEIDTIVRWIDAGAPQGNPFDAPPPLAWPSEGWSIGKPDLVLDFPEYTAKPTNTDETVLLFGDYLFPQETWVEKIEFRATNYRLVHHAGINGVGKDFFVPKDRILDSKDEDLDHFGGQSNGGRELMRAKNHLYTWLPGQRVEPRPEGDAFRIGSGERIVIQTHIAPTSEAERVKIQLGLKFFTGELKNQRGLIDALMRQLRVPPNDSDYTLRQWHEFGADTLVTGFDVHMHVRGKASRIVFHYPDGRDETAFDLPHYSFAWQRYYLLTQPYRVPAGTKVEFIAEWDNSANNPNNPNPNVEVPWGSRTTDEMYGGQVLTSVPREHPLHIVNGIAVNDTAQR